MFSCTPPKYASGTAPEKLLQEEDGTTYIAAAVAVMLEFQGCAFPANAAAGGAAGCMLKGEG
jgi:hypothetical protein